MMIKNIKTFFGLFIMASLILSASIVWQPVYFLLFILAAVFLIIIFWKTEESLIALIFYLPFQIALNVSNTIDLASSRLFIITLFIVWLLKSLAKKKLVIPCQLTTCFILVFLGLATLSACFSIDQDKSAVRLLFFLSIVPLYFVAANYLNLTVKITKAIYVLLFSAALAAIVGIVQFLSQFVFGIDVVMDFWSKNTWLICSMDNLLARLLFPIPAGWSMWEVKLFLELFLFSRIRICLLFIWD